MVCSKRRLLLTLLSLLLLQTAECTPSYELHAGTDDAQVSSKMANNNTQFIKVLGSATTITECGDLCTAWRNVTDSSQRCQSFTLYNSSASADLASKCYGHTSFTWFPHVSNIATSGRVQWPCNSSLDCSLNGVCEKKTSVCNCDSGWTGLRCGTLDLLPVDRSKTGYRNNSMSTWGGGVAASPDGKYHMWTCELTHSCGILSWFANSEVGHMVSNSPEGPYQRMDLTFPPFSTNPSMTRGPNGEYVMAVATATLNGSARIPSNECNCTDGSTPKSCSTPRPPFYTNLAISNTTSGPWRFLNVLGHRSWGFNFDLVINQDGSAVGVTRLGFVHSTKWDDPTAWGNPFKDSFSAPEANAEDPFVYKVRHPDTSESYHCLYHAFVPKALQQEGRLNYPGSHSFSLDGKTWYYSGAAYSNNVSYTDGSSELMHRRERPHVVTNNANEVVAITNGVIAWDDGGEYGDRSFTLVQPIAT